MRLMVFRTAGVKRVLKVEIIVVTAVNQRKDAAVTPVMKGRTLRGQGGPEGSQHHGSVDYGLGLNQVTTQAEEMVLHTDRAAACPPISPGAARRRLTPMQMMTASEEKNAHLEPAGALHDGAGAEKAGQRQGYVEKYYNEGR